MGIYVDAFGIQVTIILWMFDLGSLGTNYSRYANALSVCVCGLYSTISYNML